MASGPITSWQIDGETVETMADFIFLGSTSTADGDCSHEIKRRLLLGRKVVTSLDSIFKSRDITLPTKVCLVTRLGMGSVGLRAVYTQLQEMLPVSQVVGRTESQCSLEVSVVAMGTIVAKGMASLQKRSVSPSITGCCSLGWAWGQLGVHYRVLLVEGGQLGDWCSCPGDRRPWPEPGQM